MQAVRRGQDFEIPIYDHAKYDLSLRTQLIKKLDVLILEGVGVGCVIKELDEFKFLDIPLSVARDRYLSRVVRLWEEGKSDSSSWYHQFFELTEEEFKQQALQIWENVNLANYTKWILPLRLHSSEIDRVNDILN
ncbi:hypothetical protein FACS1894125_6890 [Actinomycetota bacterium]|nr:hypothetical protein FACS1894125_6890 [Actinomycetota bacterium]